MHNKQLFWSALLVSVGLAIGSGAEQEVLPGAVVPPRVEEPCSPEQLHTKALQYLEGKDQNLPLAIELLRQAAEGGYAAAQYALGELYTQSFGELGSPAAAAKWYRMAAEQGVAEAQYNLALCHHYGEGVEPDMKEAVKWYRAAAAQGHVYAQNALATCYDEGLGVKMNKAVAAKWYQTPAEQDFVDAQYALAQILMHHPGRDAVKDRREAVQWYRVAAENGHSNAQRALAWCYMKDGDAELYARGLYWLHRAAEECADAQYELGLYYLYAKGRILDEQLVDEKGTTKEKWARCLLWKAAKGGHLKAEQVLSSLVKRKRQRNAIPLLLFAENE